MKNKKNIVLGILGLALVASAISVSAIGTWGSGFKMLRGGRTLISAHGECKNVVATSAAKDYFIPTKSDREWLGFRNAVSRLSGVSLDGCEGKRISGWQGKVNQHMEGSVWKTDPTGDSGYEDMNTDAKRITYCQKFYPLTIGVSVYGTESITFKAAGNSGSYPATKTTYTCEQGRACAVADWNAAPACASCYKTSSTKYGTKKSGAVCAGTTGRPTRSCSATKQCCATSDCGANQVCSSGSCVTRACTASDWNAAPACSSCYTANYSTLGTKKSGAVCTGGTTAPTRSCSSAKACCSDAACGAGKLCSGGSCVSAPCPTPTLSSIVGNKYNFSINGANATALHLDSSTNGSSWTTSTGGFTSPRNYTPKAYNRLRTVCVGGGTSPASNILCGPSYTKSGSSCILKSCSAGSGKISNWSTTTVAGVRMSEQTWTWPTISAGQYATPGTVYSTKGISNGTITFRMTQALCSGGKVITTSSATTVTTCNSGYNVSGTSCVPAPCPTPTLSSISGNKYNFTINGANATALHLDTSSNGSSWTTSTGGYTSPRNYTPKAYNRLRTACVGGGTSPSSNILCGPGYKKSGSKCVAISSCTPAAGKCTGNYQEVTSCKNKSGWSCSSFDNGNSWEPSGWNLNQVGCKQGAPDGCVESERCGASGQDVECRMECIGTMSCSMSDCRSGNSGCESTSMTHSCSGKTQNSCTSTSGCTWNVTSSDSCPSGKTCQGSPLTCATGCFIPGTSVLMADGTYKNIEDIEIGEFVKGENSTKNKVLTFIRPTVNGRDMVSINGSEYFVTSSHPLKTIDGWKSVDPEASKLETPELTKELGIQKLDIGDNLITENGLMMVYSILSNSAKYEEDERLYNFELDGDNTYYADGFLVHNKSGSGSASLSSS